jgi:DNA modification methylase
MSAETFLNGRVTLHAGDSRDVLKTIPDCSIDSIVTDPPYALVSIVKRFGGKNAAAVVVPEGGSGAYARASSGFMGKQWDTGETAFAVDFWAECLRVLKPGGHVVAFSGTRTYHRMACAIEDAGFEVRDMLSWLYGSGFPKSHDVSKGIDRAAGAEREILGKRQFANGSFARDGAVMGQHGVYGTAAGNPLMTAPATDSAIQWQGWGTALKPACEPIMFARKPLIGTVAANVLKFGTGAINVDACRVQPAASRDSRHDSNICTCSEPKAAQKSRNGDNRNQALSEPSPVPQNAPLSNAGLYGNGHQPHADSLDGCLPCGRSNDEPALEVEGGGQASARQQLDGRRSLDRCATCGGIRDYLSMPCDTIPNVEGIGRWPANIIHDGSEEVIAAFPDLGQSGVAVQRNGGGQSIWGADNNLGSRADAGFSDSGSAARFFYTAKADQHDRIGSKHPTVKPVDLMQWLCRLVTPPGGTVLDPFAGTGTTGEAAYREGFNAILIERETEYQADIRRRMGLVLSGPDERARESIKARTAGQPIDHGPLFGGLQAEAAE